ncbi:MAG: hypothetical protein QG633_217 [Patescibacteria group bacterium]|jgi:O-antigen/teichoic acid export membrane protein|nr:hypothetical protein [Patescibacteria group bacterium]
MENLKQQTVRLLRWSERYTKTDMVYLTRGSAWVSSTHMVTSVMGLLASIAFANFLPQETFGEYKYVLSIAGFLAALTLPGINTALTRASAGNNDGALMLAWATKLKWGILATIASSVLSLFYFLRGDTGLSLSFLVAALFLPFVEASLSYYPFLTGKSLFRDAASKQSLIIIATNALVITTAFFSKELVATISAYFFSWALIATFFFFQTKRTAVKNEHIDDKMVEYGVHMSAIGIIESIATYLDKVLLFNLLGPVALATFSFAIVFPQNVKSAIRNISQVAFPKFVNKSLADIGASLHTKVLIAALLSIPIAIIYWICAPLIFEYLFPQYGDAVMLSRLYAIIIIFAPKVLYRTALEARGRKRELYVFQMTSSLAKIGLLAILIPLFGIIGALWAVIATEVIVFILIALLFEKARYRETVSPEGI